MDEPLAVALKFGFLLVLYLFLLWMARSAMRDLARYGGTAAAAEPVEAPSPARRERGDRDLRSGVSPRLQVIAAMGHEPGTTFDVGEGATFGRSDVGRQRTANEDSLVVRPPLFAVADGMGGAKAGEVASAVAVEAVEDARDSSEPAEAQLAGIVRDANRRIYELAAGDESRRGMGTTLTLAMLHGDEVSLAHVGDSRAYRLRGGELQQLTRDHSLVAELERSGQITAEAAEHHPQRSIITRALGPEPDVEVDTYTLAGREGDLFLICSDGLTSMVSDEEMASILRSARSLGEAADELVRAANQSGGKDNITVILFRLGEGEGADGGTALRSVPGDEDTIAGEIRAEDVQAPAEQPAARADEPLTALRDAPADATVVRPAPARTEAPAPAGTPRRRRRARRVVGFAVTLLLLAAVVAG